MNLTQLRTEVQARGFNHVSSARIGSWLNFTYHDICDRFPWPFLETTTSGTAPLTISDLSHVLSATDTTADEILSFEDFRGIRERDPSVSGTGTPESWYLSTPTTFSVYPANTSDTISVRYIKVPEDLADDSDTPELPSRFHYALVDGAVMQAYKDADEIQAAQALEVALENQIVRMQNSLLVPNYDGPADIGASYYGSSDW